MRPTGAKAVNGIVRVRNDSWWMIAVPLITASGSVTVLGLLSVLGWNRSVPAPPALVVGLLGVIASTWILIRLPEIVIDPNESILTIRRLIGSHDQRFSLATCLYVGLRPSSLGLTPTGLPPLPEGLYDVVLCMKHGDLRLHSGLKLSMAAVKAELVGNATRRPVIRI
jgi:hypothetical protein